MSDGSLPEQPHLWPRNPYRLLGVDAGVEERELKRAYTRLIRKYKPEHFPQEFRLIRDAYETILQRMEPFRSGAEELATEAPQETRAIGDAQRREEPSAAGSAPDASLEAAPGPAPFRTLVGVEEQLTAIWNEACEGRLAEAYRRAVELERCNPGQRVVCERLYWLLTAAPELDAERTRLHWLAAGLKSGWFGRSAALYQRELAAEAAEAAGARCAALLESERLPERMLDLAKSRWQGIAPGEALVGVIAADLELLRARMRLGDDLVWAHTLLAAIENLAWAEGGFASPLWQDLCRELTSLHHLELRLANELLRFDMLSELAADWHALRRIHVSPRLLEVVRLSWSRSVWQIDAEVGKLLGELNRDHQHALRVFELVDQRGPIVLKYFAALLRQIAANHELDGDVHSMDEASKLIVDYLLDISGFGSLQFMPFSYSTWRRDLLPFFLDRAISPRQFASVSAAHRHFDSGRAESLARELAKDLPLNCLWLAHRLFWA